ncbi:MAG: divalent-cation tolerance protein CutA [Bryobacterales bacterium]|nr:divalent-cation tolerance protein CutA [Bryobacterales bacterium]
MTGKIVILCNCGSLEEAQTVARGVVGRRQAACVNIVPGVHSVYRWEGKVEEAAEWMLVIKTQETRYAEVESTIRELHSYTTPEIIALTIDRGLPAYLDWILEETSPIQ